MSHLGDRIDYTRAVLDPSMLDPDPIQQFQAWYADALQGGVHEPNAMTLATATPDGRPSARIVLLRHADARGFSFFTNYGSRKGRELEANPRAALVFHWAALERQVRVEGRVEVLPELESDSYFRSRPVGSQLGAWVSPQSQVIPDRAALEREAEELRGRFGSEELIPRPPFWGGFRVVPDVLEFWQGRASRLHDRCRYRRDDPDDSWILERLAP